MRVRALLGGTLLSMLCGVALVAARTPAPADAFNHPKHAKLFVSCATCHVGAERADGAIFPEPLKCAACHDGSLRPKVTWQPRTGPRASNLRFSHAEHLAKRSTGTCADCHAAPKAAWMTVRGPQAAQCLTCHKLSAKDHVALPDSTCATCHLALSEARSLPAARIAAFPRPPNHDSAGFGSGGGHGAAATAKAGASHVAVSCATCHVRIYCVACHVNAPEVPAIQALGLNPAATAEPQPLTAPADHASGDFETRHGALAGRGATACRTCHTQESCAACHNAQLPASARALFQYGPDRGHGAATTAKRPTSHTPVWESSHGPAATASTRSCASCHRRESCLACHVPDPAKGSGYHPASFLTRHPAEAYTRSASCADCHNQAQFCQSCHQSAGVVAQRSLLGAGGYHDGNRQFFVGHGQAARQSLESCASCHVERDCLTCHSAQKGRGFSPHGPGFDAERLLQKNPQLCMACHGTAIPRRRT